MLQRTFKNGQSGHTAHVSTMERVWNIIGNSFHQVAADLLAASTSTKSASSASSTSFDSFMNKVVHSWVLLLSLSLSLSCIDSHNFHCIEVFKHRQITVVDFNSYCNSFIHKVHVRDDFRILNQNWGAFKLMSIG